ncbi:MAG: hypothetical protein GEV12_00345 [Micromonosporaceae bacterium]|nr:hypothetical protein [Micromonosporaceae bacterium]
MPERPGEGNMSVMGVKLQCPACGAEAVVTRRGTGTARCHGEDLVPVSGAGRRAHPPATGDAADGAYLDEEGHS